MKVAFFLGALNQGGMESLVLDVCRHKEDAPFSMAVIYRKDGTLTEAYHSTGVRLIRIKKRQLAKYLLDLRHAIRKEGFDVIHSQTPSNTFLLFFVLFGLHVKVVTTLHGFSFSNSPWWQKKIVYLCSKKIICVSEYERQYYIDKWHLPRKNKLCVVYNGVDFSKLDQQGELSEPLPGRTDIVRLTMVGSFMEGRSQLQLVKSLATMNDEDLSAFDFYFVGRRIPNDAQRYDDCVDYCRQGGLSNVHFLGGRNDVPTILKSMDGFVYCTEHDTFGIAVIEAMASGLPVVVNDWIVMKEICHLDGVNDPVIFYETDSKDECVAAIKRLLDNLDEYREKAEKIKPYVREKYSIQKHIVNLMSVYSGLMEQ